MWSGTAAETAITTSGELDHHRTHLHRVHTSASAVINDAAQISHTARTQLRTVETAWAADKIAVGPYANTPEGKAALLRAGQQRIHEATQVIQTAAAQFQGAAQQVHTLAGRLPRTGGGSVEAVDFKTAPNNLDDPYFDAPPDPTGGYGSYHYGYEFHTREGWTKEQIMVEIQRNFNRYFTFTGDADLTVGATLNLTGPFGESEPVRVSDIGANSFSLVSLPGHAEGAGRVIKFTVSPAAQSPIGGQLTWELGVEASGPLSKGSLVPGSSWLNKMVWQVFSDNLHSRLPSVPPQTGITHS